jgi:TatD DNase family protein
MQLVDTHVHINFETFESELDALRDRWRSAGVTRLVHSCVEPTEFGRTQALARRFPELWFAIGLHPLETDRWTSAMGEEILSQARSEPKVVAIGETGLDLYKADNPAQQMEACRAQLAIARQLNLPVIIHCRDAAEPMARLLRETNDREGAVRGVMHCWGGTPEQTQWFLDLGFYISFSGIVTFKKAQQVRDSVKIVPRDRLLVETDCPFLAPVPRRGKRNEPAYVRYVAECVAQVRGEPVEALAEQTSRNACDLFDLGAIEATPTSS